MRFILQLLQKFKKRTIIITIIIYIAFGLVIWRLADIMLFNSLKYTEKANAQHIEKEIVPAKRGIIYDRNGYELAINIETDSIYCNPSEISSFEKTANFISKAINKEPKEIVSKLYKYKNKRFCWIERKPDANVVQSIKDYIENLRSARYKAVLLKNISERQKYDSELKDFSNIKFITEIKRFYPQGSLGAHVIGFVNFDNNKGLEGVEKSYEGYLFKKDYELYTYKDAKGNILSSNIKKEIKGNNLVLTLDENLQGIVEKHLEQSVFNWQAQSGSAIMMNPYTGEILAMANVPTFDLNKVTDISKHILEDKITNPVKNRAITNLYEPGSTFKIIVGAGALEEGVVNPKTKIDCSEGYIEIEGKKIKDLHRQGILTFQEVIQKSSNVGTIKTSQMLGKARLYKYIKQFGFGSKTGIDLPGERAGIVWNPSEGKLDKHKHISIGAMAIGQGLSVTPLQILRAYSVIANGGILVKPFVISKIISPEGNIVYTPFLQRQRVLSEKTASTLRSILKSVTESGGTATMASVDGNRVAGKTGTAQVVDDTTKKYSKNRFIVSFVGFVPADKPKFSMIVVLDVKGDVYGGIVAAPVFRAIANEALSYMDVPRDDSKEERLIISYKHKVKNNRQ